MAGLLQGVFQQASTNPSDYQAVVPLFTQGGNKTVFVINNEGHGFLSKMEEPLYNRLISPRDGRVPEIQPGALHPNHRDNYADIASRHIFTEFKRAQPVAAKLLEANGGDPTLLNETLINKSTPRITRADLDTLRQGMTDVREIFAREVYDKQKAGAPAGEIRNMQTGAASAQGVLRQIDAVSDLKGISEQLAAAVNVSSIDFAQKKQIMDVIGVSTTVAPAPGVAPGPR